MGKDSGGARAGSDGGCSASTVGDRVSALRGRSGGVTAGASVACRGAGASESLATARLSEEEASGSGTRVVLEISEKRRACRRTGLMMNSETKEDIGDGASSGSRFG